MGGGIKITGNLFRETSFTFCYIKTVAIFEFLFKNWRYLMYLKRDMLTCHPYLSVCLYLPADGHSKLHSDASCDTFRCYIYCTYHKILPSEYLEFTRAF